MPRSAQSQVVDLFALAIADGFATPEELALVHERAAAFGLGEAAVASIIKEPSSVPYEPPRTLVEAIARLYDLGRVLLEDGIVDPREVQLMTSFATRFGIAESIAASTVTAVIEEIRTGTSRDDLIQRISTELGA